MAPRYINAKQQPMALTPPAVLLYKQAKGGKPMPGIICFTDDVALQHRIDEYFAMCESSRHELKLKNGDLKIRYDIPCTMIGLSNFLGTSKDTLYSYINGEKKAGLSEDKLNKISACLANARSRIEQITLDRALCGDYEPKAAARILSGFGYADKSDDNKSPIRVIVEGSNGADWSK